MARMISFTVLLACVLIIGFLSYRVLSGFLLPLFLAVLLVVIFRPLHKRVLQRFPTRHRTAAGITTLAVLLIVLVPVCVVALLAAAEGSSVVAGFQPADIKQRFEALRDSVAMLRMPHAELLRRMEQDFQSTLEMLDQGREPPPRNLSELEQDLKALQAQQSETTAQMVQRFERLNEGLQKLEQPAETVEQRAERELAWHDASAVFQSLKRDVLGGPVTAWIKEQANPTDDEWNHYVRVAVGSTLDQLFAIGSRTTAFVVRLLLGLVIMTLAFYFFLVDGPQMLESLMRLSPLDDAYERELWEEFEGISRAVVVATLLSALAQGLLAGVAYWLVGFGSVFLLTSLTTLAAMIPFVGAAVVWFPACLWLAFYDQRMYAGIFLAVYGIAVISMADNFIKPYILAGRARLHPLLGLLSVLGGVNALGPIGILVGPMVVAFLQTLLNLLQRELTSMDTRNVGATVGKSS